MKNHGHKKAQLTGFVDNRSFKDPPSSKEEETSLGEGM